MGFIGYGAAAILLVVCVGLIVVHRRVRAELATLRDRFAPVLDVDAEVANVREATAAAASEVAAQRKQLDDERQRFEQEAAAARQESEQQRAQVAEEIKAQREKWEHDFSSAVAELEKLTKEVDHVRDQVEMQSFGLYEPVFDFDTSDAYKDALAECRSQQKQMIRDGTAAHCPTNWIVQGSEAEGRRSTARMLKLMLRAFNGECDAIIAKVKFNNVTAIEERIRKAYEALNKLGASSHCSVTSAYLELKLEELQLTHEYAEKKQAEKEEQQRIREQMRDEEKARKEIEKAQEEAEREEKRWADALEKARRELAEASENKKTKLEAQLAELERRLAEAHENKERAVSRAQLTKSGHVYVISNEGSFGRNVFKIGMTRRLDPLERVKELSDASVPFAFDVHAMMYSENAPELEAKLHGAFDERRVNLVNNRKEFFQVSLNEVEAVVRESFGDVEFVRTAIAEEYRKSLAVRCCRPSLMPASPSIMNHLDEGEAWAGAPSPIA